jgi:Fe-S-cluster containining protein
VSVTVAVITLNITKNVIKSVDVLHQTTSFKCTRCATLCCKLGGPPLTGKDVKRLVQAGFTTEQFVDCTETKMPNTVGVLKSGKDGGCLFLEFDADTDSYTCGVYDARPTLCRVYPFKFEKSGENKVLVKIIPCCLGLNNPNAKQIDKKFVEENLATLLLDAVELL